MQAQSPYSLQWGKESIIVGAGFLSAIISSEIDGGIAPLTVDEITQLQISDINSFDRSATTNYSKEISQTSDIALGITLASPLSFSAITATNNDITTIGVMYTETLLISVFLPSYAKGGVQRIRPFVYNSQAPLQDKLTTEAKRSFFSGHTTLAFSSAVFLSTVFSHYNPDSDIQPYLWGGSLVAASAIGYMRYASGAHFPTDILAGAIIGSAIGYLIPALHENNSKLTMLPSIEGNSAILHVQYSM